MNNGPSLQEQLRILEKKIRSELDSPGEGCHSFYYSIWTSFVFDNYADQWNNLKHAIDQENETRRKKEEFENERQIEQAWDVDKLHSLLQDSLLFGPTVIVETIIMPYLISEPLAKERLDKSKVRQSQFAESTPESEKLGLNIIR